MSIGWAGTITVGWKPDGRRDRIIVRGRTKTEVKEKLRARHQELAAGVRTPANFTVERCLNDWLETLNPQAEITVTGYRIMTRHLIELIGNVKLAELKVRDVDFALGRLAKRLSTRSVRLARMILTQAAIALGPLFESRGGTDGGQSQSLGSQLGYQDLDRSDN